MIPTTSLAPPRLVNGGAKLIFGLGEIYSRQKSNAEIPAQWGRFLPWLNQIGNQVGKATYGVMSQLSAAGDYEYVTGVEVSAFPAQPDGFTRVELPAQTYAVFEFLGHISGIGAAWKEVWSQSLPASGYRATDGRFFERYGEDFDGGTGVGGVGLWIPIKTQ